VYFTAVWGFGSHHVNCSSENPLCVFTQYKYKYLAIPTFGCQAKQSGVMIQSLDPVAGNKTVQENEHNFFNVKDYTETKGYHRPYP